MTDSTELAIHPKAWLPWINSWGDSPYNYKRVEARRIQDLDDRIFQIEVCDLDPRFNVAGLWWRPVQPTTPS